MSIATALNSALSGSADSNTTTTDNWFGPSSTLQYPSFGWYYGYVPSVEAERLIAIYKREFGKDWEAAYQKTVRLELK